MKIDEECKDIPFIDPAECAVAESNEKARPRPVKWDNNGELPANSLAASPDRSAEKKWHPGFVEIGTGRMDDILDFVSCIESIHTSWRTIKDFFLKSFDIGILWGVSDMIGVINVKHDISQSETS